jgi:phage anti-repressor protein
MSWTTFGNLKVTARRVGDVIIDVLDARKVHEYLRVPQNFNDWIRHQLDKAECMENVGFVKAKNRSLYVIDPESPDKRPRARVEYYVSRNVMSEIAMTAETPMRKSVCQYYIDTANQVKKELTEAASKGDSKAAEILQVLIDSDPLRNLPVTMEDFGELGRKNQDREAEEYQKLIEECNWRK